MTTAKSDSTDAFVRWFGENASRLREESAAHAADEIGAQLLSADERLGVETADDEGGGDRELIFTAFSDSLAFPVVHKVAHALAGTRGWDIRALKPERGFEFDIELSGVSLEVGGLKFTTLDGGNGIGIVVPPPVHRLLPKGREVQELAWLILETGVGEELAAGLDRAEFLIEPSNPARPIAELALYLRSGGGGGNEPREDPVREDPVREDPDPDREDPDRG